jgi:asparagine synthase (glutamine-hydrolysing)
MCGIAGFWVMRASSDLDGIANRMATAIRHRGPDDSGTWTDGTAGVAFGFRRLAIIDVSEQGHQPMLSASGRFVIIFNGEVFNFRAIRKELEARGALFRGHSDTEVMLAAFEAWGIEDAVRRFVGMFAIAVWDKQDRELTLIRDRLGIKPLYIFADSGVISFGSELKALVAGPVFDSTLNSEGLASFLRYLYIPAPHTIYKKVHKLLPGHLLRIRNPAQPPPPSVPYWSVDKVIEAHRSVNGAVDDHAVLEQFDQLLIEAVKLRLESDVPLGALLSGGVDSSVVVAIMQSLATRPVRTFTIGFDEQEHNEATFARAVARHLGTNHTELLLSGADALAVVPSLPEMFDEPLADPSQIPTFLICRLARQSVTVALTGDGGDELFAGYNRYVDGERLLARATSMPSSVRRMAGGVLTAVHANTWDAVQRLTWPLLPRRARVRLAGGKVQKVGLVLLHESDAERYGSLMSFVRQPTLLLSASEPYEDHVLKGFEAFKYLPLLERMMAVDQKHYLPDDLLAKVDRASMAVSLEARVPLLDHRLVEFSWRLPRSFKIRDGVGKWILKQSLYKRVPREIVDRPKVGFTVPIKQWLQGPLAEWASDLLSDRTIAKHGVLQAGVAANAWKRFRSGKGEDPTGLWAMAMLQAWLERWH